MNGKCHSSPILVEVGHHLVMQIQNIPHLLVLLEFETVFLQHTLLRSATVRHQEDKVFNEPILRLDEHLLQLKSLYVL